MKQDVFVHLLYSSDAGFIRGRTLGNGPEIVIMLRTCRRDNEEPIYIVRKQIPQMLILLISIITA